jgi:hypothetical protein
MTSSGFTPRKPNMLTREPATGVRSKPLPVSHSESTRRRQQSTLCVRWRSRVRRMFAGRKKWGTHGMARPKSWLKMRISPAGFCLTHGRTNGIFECFLPARKSTIWTIFDNLAALSSQPNMNPFATLCLLGIGIGIGPSMGRFHLSAFVCNKRSRKAG